MDIETLKQHRAHFEHYGNMAPLPTAVMLDIFDLAETGIIVATSAPAKKTKAAASDTLVAN